MALLYAEGEDRSMGQKYDKVTGYPVVRGRGTGTSDWIL